MDVFSLLRIVGRRWYIFGLGLLLTVGAAVRVADTFVPDFQMNGTMILLAPDPPAANAPAQPNNPYLTSNAALKSAGDVVTQVLSSSEQQRNLAARGATGAYALRQSQYTATIDVTSIAPTPAQAEKTIQVLFAAIQQELATLQRSVGVPPESQITAKPLITPTVALQLEGNKSRTVLTVIAIGVAGSATLAVLVDSLIGVRRRRKQEAASRRSVPRTPIPGPGSGVSVPSSPVSTRRAPTGSTAPISRPPKWPPAPPGSPDEDLDAPRVPRAWRQ